MEPGSCVFRSTSPSPCRTLVFVVGLTAASSGCSGAEDHRVRPFYERKIAPILQGACVTSATGSRCHVTADDKGNALGNLDVTSYDMLVKRRDLFPNYGPYGMPNLLLKNVPPFEMRLVSWDGVSENVTTNITHAGGSPLSFTSTSFTILESWLERGGTINNDVPLPPTYSLKPCVEKLGKDPAFDATTDPQDADYSLFVDSVNEILVEECGAGNCHGAVEASLYLTCGKTPEQLRWNYFAAGGYVSQDAEASEILRRALDPAKGGVYHDGGTIFSDAENPSYQAILEWAKAKGGPSNVPSGPGFDVFTHRVQPVLAKRGCLVLSCHSPLTFADYRLSAGSAGHFSLPATRRNYEQTLGQVALESPDPNASRLLRKNLPPGMEGGIRHRGGPLLASGVDPSACDQEAAATGPLDEQDPYCVINAWIAKERAERTADLAPLSGIVFVRRTPAPGPDRPQDYDSYAPGSDLRFAGATMDEDGLVTTDGTDRSLLGDCGLDPATVDVREPDVSFDASRVVFTARTSESEPFRIYTVGVDGTGCAVEPVIDAAPVDDQGDPVPTNGEMIHNFDPAFAPDGSIVFASTRGNTKNRKVFGYDGPQRSPADVTKVNANLYITDHGKVRQLTFMLNQELNPSFKQNGQILFTVEKRAPGFYQLGGRRINFDGGDYHPLFGQRRTVGHEQITDLVQLADKNFAAIASDRGAQHRAGTVMIANRSLGPDTVSRSPEDYLVDPAAMDHPSPKFFQHSVTYPDTGATGHLEGGTKGAYRNISPLPSRSALVSYAGNVTDLGNFSGNFDVVVLDTITGRRTPLAGLDDPNQDEVWPVAVYGRYDRGMFQTSLKTGVQGAGVVYTADDGQPRVDRADLTFLDVPMLLSLLFQNTRSGRALPDVDEVELWVSLPPEGITSFDQDSPFITEDRYGKLYVRRAKVVSAPLLDDGSLRAQIPGGVPVLLAYEIQLAGDSEPKLHHMREELQFYPGEWTRLSMRRETFNGFCGGCHGSVSGLETDVTPNPDVLTHASQAMSVGADPADITGLTPEAPVGPPFP